MDLCSIQGLLNYRVNLAFKADNEGTDLGEAVNFFVDLRKWDIRFVQIKSKPSFHRVTLIIPQHLISEVQVESRRIFVSLKKHQLNSYIDSKLRHLGDSTQTYSSLKGYSLAARGDSLGHLEDLICERKNLKVRFLVIRIGTGWHRSWVLAPVEGVSEVITVNREIQLSLSQETIQNSPLYERRKGIYSINEEKVLTYYSSPQERLIKLA